MVYQRFQGVEMDAIIGDFGSFSVWIRSIEQAQQYLGLSVEGVVEGVCQSTNSLTECSTKFPTPL